MGYLWLLQRSPERSSDRGSPWAKCLQKEGLRPQLWVTLWPDLCDVMLNSKTHCLRVSVTDRTDLYHQVAVSQPRAISNTLGRGFSVDPVQDTRAFADFVSRSSEKHSRLSHGDDLFLGRVRKEARPGVLFAAFGSILQGDHAGVEFACPAHAELLWSGPFGFQLSSYWLWPCVLWWCFPRPRSRWFFLHFVRAEILW